MRVERRNWPRWLTWIVGVVAAWAMLALLLVLQVLPDTPKTTRGWVLLLVVGPPVYGLLEWAVDRRSAKNGARNPPAQFSFARVAIALLVALVALAPLVWWFLRGAN